MTYTLLVRDRAAGLLAAATASRSLAAGNAVIAVAPRTGAVASQAWTNRALRERMLDAMAGGATATDAVARVPEWDDDHRLRQVAALGVGGAPAARDGADISAWAGHRILDDAVVAGNLLVGAEVVDAIAASIAATDAGDADAVALARRAVAAMRAGEAAGGDVRGRQSAALLVAQIGRDTVIDLRVDDHVDPLGELARLVELRAADLVGLSARTA